MKHLIVGDIHGKVEVVEKALAQEFPVIFVGDILDSFDRPVADHVKCMELIFAAIDSGKARCLYGNHEMSYLYDHMQCSGYNPATAAHVLGDWQHQMAGRFKHFLWFEPNILITHGGLDWSIWDEFKLTVAELPQVLTEWSQNTQSPAYRIGRSRGGMWKAGGIYWCDFDREFTPIPELVQIVGHTRGKTLRTHGENFCIDYNDYNAWSPFYYDLQEVPAH